MLMFERTKKKFANSCYVLFVLPNFLMILDSTRDAITRYVLSFFTFFNAEAEHNKIIDRLQFSLFRKVFIFSLSKLVALL